MGRLKKYLTVEEKKEAARIASKKYYWKNKSEIDNRAIQKYQSRKKHGDRLSAQEK